MRYIYSTLCIQFLRVFNFEGFACHGLGLSFLGNEGLFII